MGSIGTKGNLNWLKNSVPEDFFKTTDWFVDYFDNIFLPPQIKLTRVPAIFVTKTYLESTTNPYATQTNKHTQSLTHQDTQSFTNLALHTL